jgi:hypothetical protein
MSGFCASKIGAYPVELATVLFSYCSICGNKSAKLLWFWWQYIRQNFENSFISLSLGFLCGWRTGEKRNSTSCSENFLFQLGDRNWLPLSDMITLGLISSPKYLFINLLRHTFFVAVLSMYRFTCFEKTSYNTRMYFTPVRDVSRLP